MYTGILAGIDEHITSEISARYAAHLAKQTGSRLFLCHIVGKEESRKKLRLAEEAIGRLLRRCSEMGIAAEHILLSGGIPREFRRVVSKEEIDVVFLAVNSADFRRRFYEGTLARKIAAALPCSVAFVNVVHVGRVHPRKILLPIKAEFDHIRERSYFAGMLSLAFGSTLYLMHCPAPRSHFFRGNVQQRPDPSESRLSHDISRITEHFDPYDVMQEKKVVHGRADITIPIEAAAKRFDLIIIGESERTLVRSLFLGNTMTRVLSSTPCNLMIFRPRHEPA